MERLGLDAPKARAILDAMLAVGFAAIIFRFRFLEI